MPTNDRRAERCFGHREGTGIETRKSETIAVVVVGFYLCGQSRPCKHVSTWRKFHSNNLLMALIISKILDFFSLQFSFQLCQCFSPQANNSWRCLSNGKWTYAQALPHRGWEASCLMDRGVWTVSMTQSYPLYK